MANLAQVAVAATTSTASEKTQTPGTFVIGLADGETADEDMKVYFRFDASSTAVLGTDFTLSGATDEGSGLYSVTLAVDSTTAAVSIVPLDAGKVGGTTTVVVDLVAADGYTVYGDFTAGTVTIQDDDLPVVSLVANDNTASESGSKSRRVHRDSHRADDRSAGGQLHDKRDRRERPGLRLACRQSDDCRQQQHGCHRHYALRSGAVGGSKLVTLSLASADNYAVSQSYPSDTVGIINDPVTVSVQAYSAFASKADNVSGQLTFTRTGPTTNDLTVNYAVDAGSTAAAGTDYYSLSGSVTIYAGHASETVSVNPIYDPNSTFDGFLQIDLGDGSGYAKASVYNNNRDGDVRRYPAAASDGQATTRTHPRPARRHGEVTLSLYKAVSYAVTVYYGLQGTAVHGDGFRVDRQLTATNDSTHPYFGYVTFAANTEQPYYRP